MWDVNKQVIQAAQDLATALRNPQTNIKNLHQNKLDALQTLVKIFSPNTLDHTPQRVVTPKPPKQLPRVHKIPTHRNQHIPQITALPKVNNKQPHVIPFDNDETHIHDPPPPNDT